MVAELGKGNYVLILKLAVVPLFIAAVTLPGRRWGGGVAGLPAGAGMAAPRGNSCVLNSPLLNSRS